MGIINYIGEGGGIGGALECFMGLGSGLLAEEGSSNKIYCVNKIGGVS